MTTTRLSAGWALFLGAALAHSFADTADTNVRKPSSPAVSETSAPVNPDPEHWVWIRPGSFTMGSPSTEQHRRADEGPQTQVTISKGFWMSKHETTQEEYLAVMDNNPSHFQGNPKHPVEQVSWEDATNYCARLTVRERAAGRLPSGYAYRLPTEAEWEYACRAGTTTATAYGNNLSSAQAHFKGAYPYGEAAKGTNSGKTTKVGSDAPNAWGLYDMHGNVWEWCLNWYAGSLPGGSVTDPQGPNKAMYRPLRGGGWLSYGWDCRSATRFILLPDNSGDDIGFRPVLAPTGSGSNGVTVVSLGQEATTSALAAASRERPFINSIGMEYLCAGTSDVLVSRWETRVKDFAAFVKATGYDARSESTNGTRPFTLENDTAQASGYDWKQADGSWQDPHFPQTREYPATCLSYLDAEQFCVWLNRYEAAKGTLPVGWRYRLPTDAEWSRAAGAAEYPWGKHWLPTALDGNYCGVESRVGFTDTPKWKCLGGFRDQHPRTSPAGSYAANVFGLFDMGGNVWEWCSTWYQTNLNIADLKDLAIVQGFPALLSDSGGQQYRVVRGGSWHAQRTVDMRTRMRGIGDPRIRFDDFGSRCVLTREEAPPSDRHDAPASKLTAQRALGFQQEVQRDNYAALLRELKLRAILC